MRYYPASLYTTILDYFVDDPNYSLQVCLVGGLAVPLEGLSPTVTTFIAGCGIVQREIQISKH